jgi:hypothetical protein
VSLTPGKARLRRPDLCAAKRRQNGSQTLPARILNVVSETPQLDPVWELDLDGEPTNEHPLNSTLADLLGGDIAQDEWPAWVDELAARIETEQPAGGTET